MNLGDEPVVRTERPTVSVIVPFAGSVEELGRALDAIARLRLRAGDEVILADNRPRSVVTGRGAVHVVGASGVRTPAFARNCGARDAHGEWLVFLDADATPSPSLLDDYFDPLAQRFASDPERDAFEDWTLTVALARR